MKASNARILLKTINKVVLALTDEEASEIAEILLKALKRMEQEDKTI